MSTKFEENLAQLKLLHESLDSSDVLILVALEVIKQSNKCATERPVVAYSSEMVNKLPNGGGYFFDPHVAVSMFFRYDHLISTLVFFDRRQPICGQLIEKMKAFDDKVAGMAGKSPSLEN